MPRLKDIERFKQELAALSREHETLAQWGEGFEDPPLSVEAAAAEEAPPAPPTVEPRGLAARAEARRRLRPAEEAPAEGLPPDFASLLAEPLPEAGPEAEALPEAEAPEAQAGAAEPPAEEEAYDAELAALLGDFSAGPEEAGAQTGTEGPLVEGLAEEGFPGEGFPEAGLPEAEAAEPEPASGAEAAEPEPASGAEDLDALLASFAPIESGSGEGEPGFEPQVEEAPEGFDLGAFAAPEFEAPRLEASEASEAGPAEPPEEAPPSPGGLPPLEDFSSLEDFSIEPESETPSPEGLEPEASLDLEAPLEPEPPLPPEAPSAEAFELPDFEAFGLPEEAGAPPPEAGPGAGPEAEEFSLPDLGGFGAEPSATAPPPAPEEDFGGFGGGGIELGEEAPELPGDFDAFDRFSFDEAPPNLAGEALDRELAALGEEAPSASTFSLEEDWTGGFGLGAAEEEKPPAPRGRPPRAEEGEERVREVSLSEAQVDRLQDRLLALPLNLRVAIEDIVANEKGSEALRSRLVWALVEGGKLEDLALLAGRVLKRRIAIPAGYEKLTGAALEAERGTLRYAFAHTVLPLLRTALLALLAVSALSFLGWRFVYRPLAANALYRAGYERIAEDRFQEAEEAFGRAGRLREFKAWYYRYAEAYAAKRQYILAERKYETLLQRYPGETEGALAWASIEREQLKYREAARILEKLVLERDYLNREALLLLGDVYLDWAGEESRYYEEARRNYAALIQRYGSKDPYLERMLLYFMRVDRLSEVLPLKDGFLAQRKPYPRAETLAELGGYLFDKGRLEDVHRLLLLADGKDPGVPETHYHLARYFGRSNSPGEERKALDKAVAAFGGLPVLSSSRLGMYVDSLVRRGRFRLEAGEYVAAEEDFARAAARYEEGLELGRLGRSPGHAEAYAGLAEVAYLVRDDLDQALRLLERAADHGYDNPEARYKRGYVHYRRGRLAEAAEQFYMAGREGGESPYLLYAFGNVLFERGDYQAAEGYYRRVVEAMRSELERLELPSPQARPSHGEIVELLMSAQNNLGAALYRSAERLGKAELRASGMAAFAESARLFDSLVRDQRSLIRPEAKNLGFLNLDFVLHPRRNIGLAIYTPIERAMRFPKR